MLSIVLLLSHGTTIALTRPWASAYCSIAVAISRGDPFATNSSCIAAIPLCYTGPVVGPVKAQSLTSPLAPVKRRAAQITPIRKTRLADDIADRIRILIVDGTFPPGQPLPGERVLAERFGVSRGSIRDAF